MKLAHIYSKRGLRKVAAVLPMGFDMVLAQTFLSNPEILHLVNVLHDLDHFIICDNGTAEGKAINFKDLVPYFDMFSEIILPDVIGDVEASMKATTEYAYLVPVNKRFVVPQGSTPNEWMDSYKYLRSRLKFVTVGIPKHLDEDVTQRWEILRMLEEANWHLDHNFHLLGLHTADPMNWLETTYTMFPWVRSVDTGAATAWAQNHKSVRETTRRYSLKFEDSQIAYSDDIVLAIGSNMALLNAAAKGKSAHALNTLGS